MEQLQTLRKGSVTGATLKIVAMVMMVIDHIGAVVVMPCQLVAGGWPWNDPFYQGLRTIGRLAFPIFCFLLVEGFFHTHDRKGYLLRLSAFALLAELAFDFAVTGYWFYPENQNVFFTLALGLLAVWGMDAFTAKGNKVAAWGIAVLCMAAAQLLRTDYGLLGVALILTFYLCRGKRSLYIAVPMVLFFGNIVYTCFSSLLAGSAPVLDVETMLYAAQEALGALSLVLIARYNGQRGQKLPKYFFYAFYPVHLLLLAGVRYLMIGV